MLQPICKRKVVHTIYTDLLDNISDTCNPKHDNPHYKEHEDYIILPRGRIIHAYRYKDYAEYAGIYCDTVVDEETAIVAVDCQNNWILFDNFEEFKNCAWFE